MVCTAESALRTYESRHYKCFCSVTHLHFDSSTEDMSNVLCSTMENATE
jgi:hypothetical protein